MRGRVEKLSDMLSLHDARAAVKRLKAMVKGEEERAKKLAGFLKDTRQLSGLMKKLPDKVAHPVMVPFGAAAFFPGILRHTNEFMVPLGEGYYAELSATQAVGVLSRRMALLSLHLKGAKAQLRELKEQLSFAQQTADDIMDDRVEITEFEDEEEGCFQAPLPANPVSTVNVVARQGREVTEQSAMEGAEAEPSSGGRRANGGARGFRSVVEARAQHRRVGGAEDSAAKDVVEGVRHGGDDEEEQEIVGRGVSNETAGGAGEDREGEAAGKGDGKKVDWCQVLEDILRSEERRVKRTRRQRKKGRGGGREEGRRGRAVEVDGVRDGLGERVDHVGGQSGEAADSRGEEDGETGEEAAEEEEEEEVEENEEEEVDEEDGGEALEEDGDWEGEGKESEDEAEEEKDEEDVQEGSLSQDRVRRNRLRVGPTQHEVVGPVDSTRGILLHSPSCTKPVSVPAPFPRGFLLGSNNPRGRWSSAPAASKFPAEGAGIGPSVSQLKAFPGSVVEREVPMAAVGVPQPMAQTRHSAAAHVSNGSAVGISEPRCRAEAEKGMGGSVTPGTGVRVPGVSPLIHGSVAESSEPPKPVSRFRQQRHSGL